MPAVKAQVSTAAVTEHSRAPVSVKPRSPQCSGYEVSTKDQFKPMDGLYEPMTTLHVWDQSIVPGLSQGELFIKKPHPELTHRS